MGGNNMWLERLSAWFETRPRQGALVLCLPAYRPDVVQDAANRLGLDLVDFRARYMAPLKWDASKLTIEDLNAAVEALLAGSKPVMLHNVEALLALKPAEVRKQWLADVLSRPLAGALVLPLFLYAAERPKLADDRCLVLDAAELPSESLLDRLSGFRG